MLHGIPSKVTVVITAYNAERHIARCVDSVLNQVSGPVNIIVVDDASSDRTSHIVASYGDAVELIRSSRNRGPARGRTVGLLKCKSEYVTFLDSDDYWRPTFIQETLSFLEANPDVIAVNTGYCKHDWNGEEYHRPVLDEADREYYGTDGRVCSDFYQMWAKYLAVLTGTVLMRTEAALKTEGQRSEFRMCEDLEFWAYLATFGRWGFIPKPLFVTDEKALTPKERLIKFKRRYMNSRDLQIEEWARRTRGRLGDPMSRQAFERCVGHVATSIALANACTLRFGASYRLTREYSQRLDAGLGSVLRYGARGGKLVWPCVCMLLWSREVIKAYTGVSMGKLLRG